MNSNKERAASANWTGSYMENPLPGDFVPQWKDNEVIEKSTGIHAEGTWEANAFSASAAYICQNGGDILQIGYGFCQAANYIQSHSIDTHTIIIDQWGAYEHATAWSQDKSNVTIITGSFYEMDLPKYDGVFINKTKLLHCNKNTARTKMKYEIPKFTKTGSLVSWYNHINDPRNMLGIDDIEYEYVELNDLAPAAYWLGSDNKNYYVPKMEII